MKRTLLFAILILWAGSSWGATYNIGPGQTYTTFTLLVATETLTAGDIVDGGGNEFRETWALDGGGSAGSPVILRNAIINGSNIKTGFADGNADGEYTLAVTTEPDFVVVDGVMWVEGTAGSLTANQWDWAANVLYIYGDPTGKVVEAAARAWCIKSEGFSHITCDNITVKHSNGKGFWFRESGANEADNITIQNCSVLYTDEQGIGISKGDNAVITNNTVVCGVEGVFYGNAIGIKTHHSDNPTILNNDVSGGIIGIQVGGAEQDRNITAGIVFGNYVHDIGAAQSSYTSQDWEGIELTAQDAATITAVYVTGNKVENAAGDGIAIQNAHSCIVANNLVKNVGKIRFVEEATEGAGIALFLDSDDNGIYNNTVYDVFHGIYLNASADDNASLNNILHTGSNYGVYSADGNSGNTSNYECVYNFTIATTGGTVSDGANSITSDPLFVSATDFHLQPGSPCIDAGADLSGTVADDYDSNERPAGTGYDIGAYEFASGDNGLVIGDGSTITYTEIMTRTNGVIIYGDTVGHLIAGDLIPIRIGGTTTITDSIIPYLGIADGVTVTMDYVRSKNSLAEIEAGGGTVTDTNSSCLYSMDCLVNGSNNARNPVCFWGADGYIGAKPPRTVPLVGKRWFH